MPPLAELVKAGIPCSYGAGGVGSIPTNFDAHHVCRWRFDMNLSLDQFMPRSISRKNSGYKSAGGEAMAKSSLLNGGRKASPHPLEPWRGME
jgi:hypothetical protein